ncbi:hypothetical protein EJB05_34511 [Eragrostis curvula]|uniref:MACPF domain-containing protein n=1 Tax=Eragrostis curvula TaxID=38414 RepID=A0A5J9U4D6_9POAL|nr:hypothetical protein EJB05_34511 [Eragrostis curvula]
MALKATAQGAAEAAIAAVGRGYDVAADIRLKYCKGKLADPNARLIDLGGEEVQDVLLPGGLTVTGVPKSIKCDKGERMRFRSDVLSFQQKDAANTKSLAFDGWCISLYTVALSKSRILLRDHVTQAVPSTWDPAALARFIDKFGTHIVVGVKMGGKDVIYLKQQHSSSLQPAVVQKRLKEMSDRRFLDAGGQYDINKDAYGKDKHPEQNDVREQRLRFAESSPSSSYASKEDLVMVVKRRGGKEWDKDMPHSEWINTVQLEPDVISMSFLPITSLLNGIPGCGFLNHAINLYLRYKPPIEELHQFLEFQLPRQWAPVYSDLPLGPQRKRQNSASLSLNFMGPKLYVCTNMVDVGERPVTGLRLYLEGKKSNMLAVHLQHLCSLPQILQLQDDPYNHRTPEPHDRKYLEPFGSWKRFSHVYTAPVESDDDSSIVTGAQLHVSSHGFRKILFLRLHFSKVCNAALVKNPEWEGSPNLGQKSGLISTLISTHFSTVAQKPAPRPADVNINSAVYPGGPPVPVQASKLIKFVDTAEMVRGPQDTPGYWVVSGAKLQLERGKISLRVKYSLLTAMVPDDEYPLDEQS